jgi:DNA gyrase subunit A
VREIADMRDETDLNGLKLAIDLKRGAEPEKLMLKLFKMTPLMDTFSCNFNILIAGMPRVMGIAEILEEWTAWRIESVRRRVYFDLTRKKEKLHLLKGLGKILLDIDKAIKIIRNTESESEVVPNLMIGFGIDEIQAEFVAEIKLRNINREYILKRLEETSALEKEIDDLEELTKNRGRIKKVIIDELKNVIKKYGTPRKTEIVSETDVEQYSPEEDIEDYQVTIFVSKHGYFKKITPLSLRMAADQKLKEDDALSRSFETTNRAELLVFTDKYQTYKVKVSDFEDTKASALGTYLPAALKMDENENVLFVMDAGDYQGSLIFFYENGKASRVPVSAYATKTNRKKLTGAYCDQSALKTIIPFAGDLDIAVYTSDNRALIFNTALLAPKTKRDTQGVSIVTLKAKHRLARAVAAADTPIQNHAKYRVKNLPAAGALLKPEDTGEEQLSLI